MSIKNKHDRRAQRTRKWLQNSLRALMQEKPYQKITVGELVKHADVARPTFYLHFETKDDLLLSLFDELFFELHQAMRQELAVENVDLHLFGRWFFAYGAKNAEKIKILLDAGVEYRLQERFQEVFAQLSEGVIALDPPDEKAQIVMPYLDEFIVTGTFVLLKRWINEGMQVPAEMMGHLVGEATSALRGVVMEWPTLE